VEYLDRNIEALVVIVAESCILASVIVFLAVLEWKLMFVSLSTVPLVVLFTSCSADQLIKDSTRRETATKAYSEHTKELLEHRITIKLLDCAAAVIIITITIIMMIIIMIIIIVIILILIIIIIIIII
jgi:hypothetical protein